MSTGSFPGVKSGRGVTLTPLPLLVAWSWKSRAIPLLPLWAVRPVQSLSACTRVHFTFTCPSLSFTVTFGLSLSFSSFALKRELKIAHQIYWLSDLWSNEALQCGIPSMQYDSVWKGPLSCFIYQIGCSLRLAKRRPPSSSVYVWSWVLKSHNAFRLLDCCFGILEQFFFNNATGICHLRLMVELLAFCLVTDVPNC